MEKVEFENQLFEAIKKDDLKSFSFLMPTNADLNLCFGRFPILSLLYLYSSFKILREYEKKLLPIHNFKQTQEKFEMYKAFKRRAGKAIRLFNDNEIVYPVLMLAVLNEKTILNNNYKFQYKNVEIIEKFNKIYNLTQKSKIKVTEKEIFFAREKLKTKHYFLFSVVAFVLALLIALPSMLIAIVPKKNGLGTEKYPTKISTAGAFLQAIKNGKGDYYLTKDIEVDAADITSNDFSGVINGNDYVIKLSGEMTSPFINTLSGTVKNLEIVLNETDIKITQNSSIISEKMLGNIENVKISGKINIQYNGEKTENSTEEDTIDVFFALFASENEGTISNCTANVFGNLVNNNQTDAFYSNFVGVNKENGKLTNCSSIGGEIQADTVDIAGIVSENYGEISSCENKTELNQTSSSAWNPYVSGIALKNYGTIKNTKNYGTLLSESTLAKSPIVTETQEEKSYSVLVSGIVSENYNTISNCENHSLCLGKGKAADIDMGGVAVKNYGSIENSKNHGEINASSSRDERGKDANGNEYLYYINAGGVVSKNYSQVTDCRNYGSIDVSGKVSNIIIGGIVGNNLTAVEQKDELSYLVYKGEVKTSLSKNNIKAISETGQVCVGGVAGYNSYGSYGFYTYYCSVLNSGFVGNIEANSKQTKAENAFYNFTLDKPMTVLAGGVVGINVSTFVQNCYSDVKFLNVESSDEIYKNYAGVIGCVGVFEYKYSGIDGTNYNGAALNRVVNNYYVGNKISSNKIASSYEISGVYAYDDEDKGFKFSSGSVVTLTDSIIYSHYTSGSVFMVEKSSLDEIPAEVKINE